MTPIFHPNDLRAYNFVNAYWLHGIAEPFGSMFFNIADVNNYPFAMADWQRHEMARLAANVRYRDVTIRVVDTEDLASSRNFNDLLTMVRQCVSEQIGVDSGVPYKHEVSLPTSSSPLTPDVIQKRLFFLYIAKRIVAGLDTPASAARRFGVSKINARIWSSILLTHGEDSFFEYEPVFHREKQREIVDQYRNFRCNAVYACSQLRFFSYARLKYLLRRNPPKP